MSNSFGASSSGTILMPRMVTVAAVQATPVFMNLEGSLAKALNLVAEAALKKAQLVVFPEAWLPGYPAWLEFCRDVAVWNHPPVKKLYARLVENSVVVPGPTTEALSAVAAEYRLTVVVGVCERVAEGAGRGTLYSSMLTFNPTGELINHHRKLLPTYSERLIYGQGDERGLRSVRTSVGRLGGLISWEHWTPLARQAMHQAGEDLHVALWPSIGELGQIACRHYAFEGRSFVIAAGSIMRARDLPVELEPIAEIANDPDKLILDGGSAVIGPDGKYIAGPAFDYEAIVMARINLNRIREESLMMDVTGHYNRPDLFELRLKTGEKASVPALAPNPLDDSKLLTTSLPTTEGIPKEMLPDFPEDLVNPTPSKVA
jgi:nitrilase